MVDSQVSMFQTQKHTLAYPTYKRKTAAAAMAAKMLPPTRPAALTGGIPEGEPAGGPPAGGPTGLVPAGGAGEITGGLAGGVYTGEPAGAVPTGGGTTGAVPTGTEGL